ncbi:hypothetical protein [Embleya sp. NBC_00896]|uniref:hypothetical protein n=1 Tax=Embleya sp. NBC_00896 TaxID=2975961 RepID=UPI002F914B29|nr:hypothetical protein OG928_43650 [Embleya sp. NBC_00896]
MQQPDWRMEYRYDVLMSYPHARARLEQAAAQGKGMSVNEFLGKAGDVRDLLSGSLDGIEQRVSHALGAALGKALGFEIRRVHTVPYPHPVGIALLGVSCAMAEAGFPLKRVVQGTDGCLLEAKLPKNWATNHGSVVCAVAGDAQQAQVQSGVQVPGQLYDWGRGNRVLGKLATRTSMYVSAG